MDMMGKAAEKRRNERGIPRGDIELEPESKQSSSSKSLFDHPDAQAVLSKAIELIATESDRGAVIIGLDLVDAELESLFKAIFPSSQTGEEKKSLLEYPGALSSVASKAAIAFSVRMMDRSLFDAITALRKLRNVVAHSANVFRLTDHRDKLERILSLGPNVPAGVNRLACEILVRMAVQRMRDAKVKIGDEEITPVTTDQSAIEWLSANQEVLGVLDERRHKFELGIGIGMICALLILNRDAIAAKYTGDLSIMK